MPRTMKECADRITALNNDPSDLYGMERAAILQSMDFDAARQFLNANVSAAAGVRERWESERVTDPIAEIVADLPVAWMKANHGRGSIVARMIAKFRGLLWLAGESYDETRAKLSGEDRVHEYQDAEGNDRSDVVGTDFGYGGKLELVILSDRVGFEWRVVDNDRWLDGPSVLTRAEALGE